MMISGKSGLNAKWSRGYTLIELLVLITIIGGVSAVMALTFSEATKLTSSDMAQAIVLAQVHQAGDWIAKDVAGAYSVSAGSSGNWTCSMSCYQWNGSAFTTSTIAYTISNGVLRRNGQYIAQYIVNPGTDTLFTKVTPTVNENNTYLLTVKAVKNNVSFSKVFKIFQRIPPQ